MAELVYRGPDRRRRPSTARQRLPRWTLAATLAGALGGAALLALLARGAVPGDLRPLADAFRILATALFFGAGVLRYARWRVTGEAYVAANSAALVVFAVVAFPTSMAARSVAATGVLGALARLVAAVTVAALLVPALGGVMVNSRLHPRRLAGAGVAVAIGAFLVLAAAVDILDAGLATSPVASAGLDVGAAVIWLGVAGLCLRAGVRRTSPSAAWSSAAIALLGMAGLVRGLAGDRGAGSSLVAVAALTLLAAVVAVTNAGADARDALSGEGNQLLETSGALADAERLLADVEARRTELVHDARSMISALDAASTTLDRHADALDEASSHAAARGDVRRAGAAGPPHRGFDCRPHRSLRRSPTCSDRLSRRSGSRGLTSSARAEDVWALGRPDDVAQAVRNLLVNASAHAPGRPVTVRAQSENGTVLLVVEDRGPGIPAGLRDQVFDRGVGAGPGGGSGLGLHVARRLMRAQGGDVTVAGRPGGGASFVVSLPAARRKVSSPVAQR